MSDATNDTTRTDALLAALAFHETYEQLAPSFGYETRAETREFDPQSANGKLMVAVAGRVVGPFIERINSLSADLDRLAGPACDYPPCKGKRAVEHSIGRREGDDFGYYLTTATVLFHHPPSPAIEQFLRERGK